MLSTVRDIAIDITNSLFHILKKVTQGHSAHMQTNIYSKTMMTMYTKDTVDAWMEEERNSSCREKFMQKKWILNGRMDSFKEGNNLRVKVQDK